MSHYQPYPQYTLEGTPETWQKKRLRFVLQMNPSKNEIRLNADELVSFVPMDAVGEYGGIRLSEEKALEDIGGGYTYFCDEDVVVAKITPCFENGKGSVANGLTNGIAFGTTELHVMRARKESLDPAFLFYITISDSFRKLGESEMYGAGGQKRVPESFFKNFRAGLPLLAEQQIIARFLDYKTNQIDALIAKKVALLSKLAEKRTALISHAVTKGLDPSVPMKDSGVNCLGEIPEHWGVIRIRHCIEFLTSGSRGWAEYFAEDGSLFLRITNVTHDSIKLKLDDLQYVVPPDGAEGRRTATASDDVIISITADLGSVAVIPDEVTHAYVSQHLALLRPQRQKVSGTWLAYQVFSVSGNAQLLGAGYGGSKIQLGLDDVKDVWIAIPSRTEQNIITQYLDIRIGKMDNQIKKIKEATEALKEYRSTLITNAVTGKIDVRNLLIPATFENTVGGR